MNKKIFSLILSCLLLCSCSKADGNSNFIKNKENKNDLKSALKNDPENAGTDKNEKNPVKLIKIKILMITNWKDIKGKMIRKMNTNSLKKRMNLQKNS